ncbi:AMP-binding protein [Myxococcota bacterium]|nr:AMP-binding protein [Myxococcota bacterium]
MTLAPFLAQAAAQPGAAAVIVAGHTVLSYGDLLNAAQRRAATLHRAGFQRGDLLAIHLQRSPEWLINALGCWLANVAFLPLDPATPPNRTREILADAQPRALITEDTTLKWARLAPDTHPEAWAAPLSAQDLAYLIYTSGSTGTPKGVLVTHAGLPALFEAQAAAFGLHPQARALWTLSPSFDASISDVGVALSSGAALLIEPDPPPSPAAWMDLLAARGVTHWDLPPALLTLLDPAAAPACLTTLIIGGAPCPVVVVRRWASRVRLISVYGPTEATVCTHLVRCDEGWSGPDLGAPLPGVLERIVDGELWLAGPCLARGYLNRPALTADRFVVDEGRRWYRTGDRVTRVGAARIFGGRMDRQIKHRGRLIAPEEIEARLEAMAEIGRAWAGLEGEGTTAQLCVRIERRAPVTAATLKARLAESLPAWMVPQRWISLDALPLTLSGKPDAAVFAEETLTPTQARLAALWQAVLGFTPRREDDFFALGGDSLQVIALLGAAEAAGLSLSAADVYQAPTLAGMAARVEAAEGARGVDQMTAAALRADVALPPALRRPLVASASPPRVILLTGATGFLGAHLLAALTRHGVTEIRCLARAADDQAALWRVQEVAARWGLPAPDPSRVMGLAGDLTRPDLGLDPRHAAEVEAVYHCAAEVNLARDYARLRANNVAGCLNVLRFVYAGRSKALHYASTLSVFVSTDQRHGLAREADDLSATRAVFGGYAQSKWAAEVMLRASGAPLSVYRLGLLTGSTTLGRAPRRDWLGVFLRGAARRGAIPDVEASVDITPVDFAAEAMTRLALKAPLSVYHLANPVPCGLADLEAALIRAGHPIRRVDAQAWANAKADDFEEIAARLAATRRDHPLDLFQATGMRFETARAEAESGLRCPPPSPALLDLYVRAALASE